MWNWLLAAAMAGMAIGTAIRQEPIAWWLYAIACAAMCLDCVCDALRNLNQPPRKP